ncbi:MAG TPA: hypothetical protein VN799_05670 [Acidimicrobiales bacterium]|nr:hypothetical protein [Acidimicrobiales bacterium]
MDLDHSHAGTIDRPTDGASVLDDAFERMGATDFELPNGFVNHGPMACEALAALGCDDRVAGWARWFVQMVGDGPPSVEPSRVSDFEGLDALGAYGRLPEWLGYFERAVAREGWERVVEVWVPRLVPGMATALFHGVIRTAHAVRAIDTVETDPRRAELARALGYWAARFHPGGDGAEPAVEAAVETESRGAAIVAAADGARHYVAQPTIFNLHGVTGAMAVALLVDHVGPDAAAAAVARLRTEHATLYGGREIPVTAAAADGWDPAWAGQAADSRDAHQVKLVEACRRGWEASGDDAFVAAARRVSR